MSDGSPAPDWRFRAEEYRTIAECMAHEPARRIVLRLAESCEQLGRCAPRMPRNGRTDCLARAQACRSFARTLRSPEARLALEQVAAQWVALAEKAV